MRTRAVDDSDEEVAVPERKREPTIREQIDEAFTLWGDYKEKFGELTTLSVAQW